MRTKKVRNYFAPRWWQFKLRYRLKKQERRLAQLVQRRKIDDIESTIDHRIIYGTKIDKG